MLQPSPRHTVEALAAGQSPGLDPESLAGPGPDPADREPPDVAGPVADAADREPPDAAGPVAVFAAARA